VYPNQYISPILPVRRIAFAYETSDNILWRGLQAESANLDNAFVIVRATNTQIKFAKWPANNSFFMTNFRPSLLEN
jgi:hypothetical protein